MLSVTTILKQLPPIIKLQTIQKIQTLVNQAQLQVLVEATQGASAQHTPYGQPYHQPQVQAQTFVPPMSLPDLPNNALMYTHPPLMHMLQPAQQHTSADDTAPNS